MTWSLVKKKKKKKKACSCQSVIGVILRVAKVEDALHRAVRRPNKWVPPRVLDGSDIKVAHPRIAQQRCHQGFPDSSPF